MTERLWTWETIVREKDMDSGSQLIQITSSCLISNNIYGEEPYNSSDGKRLVIIRTPSTNWRDYVCEFWVADLEKNEIIRVDTGSSLFGTANSAWGDYFYYLVDEGKTLRRFSLKSLDIENIFHFTDCPIPNGSGSVSPDNRYYINLVYPPYFGILRVDMVAKKWRIIHQHPEIFNPHAMFDRSIGEQILIQHNRGGKTDKDGRVICWIGPQGCTLYLIDKDGKSVQQLPVGPPYTADCTGHECFVGDTGKILFSTFLDSNSRGSLYIAGPGDQKPRLVTENKIYFGHVSASKCGKYFVVDGFKQAGTPIYLGNINTGKFRRLITSGASSGSPEYTHACPYMTADNKWVILNSDRTGVPQVYAASVPEKFLESLQ
ncbi:MAG: hypothetical protein ABIG61_05835 [Planctomycetota bacterium]